MEILPIKTPVFKVNQSLINFIKFNVKELSEGDVLVITSKIVALAEGRVGKIEDKEQIIKSEAKEIIKTSWADLTLSERGWEINAGVDESNADEGLILLPKDSWQSAEKLQTELKEMFGIKNLGVIISDTKSIPLRIGTVGRVIGCAGFLPIKSYVGEKDLYGRKSRVTISNIADALATSAVLMMGEGDEQTPLAIIKNAPVSFTDKSLNKKDKELNLSPEQDIFSYVYKRGG